MHRSYLFAPGHNEKLLSRVFDAGADAVMLDLEDAVPAHAKEQARTMVADALAERSAGYGSMPSAPSSPPPTSRPSPASPPASASQRSSPAKTCSGSATAPPTRR
jgi:HpcH/HpaI aldolase/citrate lyase family